MCCPCPSWTSCGKPPYAVWSVCRVFWPGRCRWGPCPRARWCTGSFCCVGVAQSHCGSPLTEERAVRGLESFSDRWTVNQPPLIGRQSPGCHSGVLEDSVGQRRILLPQGSFIYRNWGLENPWTESCSYWTLSWTETGFSEYTLLWTMLPPSVGMKNFFSIISLKKTFLIKYCSQQAVVTKLLNECLTFLSYEQQIKKN